MLWNTGRLRRRYLATQSQMLSKDGYEDYLQAQRRVTAPYSYIGAPNGQKNFHSALGGGFCR